MVVTEADLAKEVIASVDSLQLVEQFVTQGVETKGYYQGSLATAEDGLYISPTRPVDTEQLPEILDLDLSADELELGAADSHHGVVFGSAVIAKSDGIQERMMVAIKPFDTKSEVAGHEHDSLVAAKALGFDTFEPLALAKHGETTFLITSRRPDIHTLDNEPWEISPSDTVRYEEEVAPHITMMAEFMADMHSRGFFHGDAQAKNFARTDTGDRVIIDLEDAHFAQNPDDLAMLFNGTSSFEESLAYADLTHCWYALIHPVNVDSPNLFLEGESTEVCMQEFESRYLNPYFDTLTAQLHPSLHGKLDLSGLKTAVYEYIRRTT